MRSSGINRKTTANQHRSSWGVAIRKHGGNHNADIYDSDEWLFADAPRTLRISAIDQIPDLIDKLIKYADKTARKIDEKTAQARDLVTAMTEADKEITKQRGNR